MKASKALPAGWPSYFDPGSPRIGLGLDVGTTTKKKSNPTVLAVTQEVGMTYFVRLIVSWKTKDPAIARTIISDVLTGLPFGFRGRRLCIDATSERYFAADLRRDLSGVIPVELIVSSESTEYMGEKMNYKLYLGNLLVNTVEDGYLALPKENWVQKDFRSVVRDRGTFEAEVDEEGRHGDVFDAVKLSLHALILQGGPIKASGKQVGVYGGGSGSPVNRKRPDHRSDHKMTLGVAMP